MSPHGRSVNPPGQAVNPPGQSASPRGQSVGLRGQGVGLRDRGVSRPGQGVNARQAPRAPTGTGRSGGAEGAEGTGDAGDGGSATVWAAVLTAALLVIGTAGIDLASAVRARHVAGSAADLAALAAAGVSSEGEERACTTARATADANGAVLRECRLDGWDALVRVEVDRGWTLVGRGPAAASARAGPAPPVSSEDATGATAPPHDRGRR